MAGEPDFDFTVYVTPANATFEAYYKSGDTIIKSLTNDDFTNNGSSLSYYIQDDNAAGKVFSVVYNGETYSTSIYYGQHTFNIDLPDIPPSSNTHYSINKIQAPDGTVYDIEATKADTLTGLTSTVTELNYCDGVTSNIQTQLNNKQAAGSYLSTTGTAARATADSNGNVIASTYELKNKTVTTLGSSGTITLTDNSINRITASSTVTFSLPSVSSSTTFHQILVQLYMSSVRTINLGTTYFFNNTAPNLSAAGKYDIIYEYDGSHWTCGAIFKGAS